jgi:uncharacterized NAD(P)/FAD-binding protein YdhS
LNKHLKDYKHYDIAIVGSGIACSMTILELSRLLMDTQPGSRQIQIAVIEKAGEFWSGIPYGVRSSMNSLAIQKLCEFVKEPDKASYIEWLEKNKHRWLKNFEQNGGEAAATWIRNNRALIEGGKWDEIYLPRYLYGLYNWECVATALKILKQKGLATTTQVQAEAIDVVPANGGSYTITLENADGTQGFLDAERVVLAVGSPPAKSLENGALGGQPGHTYINDIYSPSEEVNLECIQKALSSVHEKKKRNILILGSNASSLEILYLINYRPEIKTLINGIVVISRSGLLPHKICDQDPGFNFKQLELLTQKGSVSALELITAIQADVQSAEAAAVNIADIFHPISAVVGQLMPRMHVSELEQFFCEHGMTFSKLMRRAGRDCREASEELAAAGMLTMVRGEFCKLVTSDAGSAFVSATYTNTQTMANITHPFPFAVVVNCGGFEELNISSSRLIRNVVKSNVCKVNSTNRGFLVNDRLEANRNLYVNGPLIGGNFNDKIRLWHVESAPRIRGLSAMLAKHLFDSLAGNSIKEPLPASSSAVP